MIMGLMEAVLGIMRLGAGFTEELAFKTDCGGTVGEGTFHSRLQGHSNKVHEGKAVHRALESIPRNVQ